MFMKQKKRMADYTSPETSGIARDYEDDPDVLEDEESQNLHSTSGNVSRKYVPKPLFQGKFSKRRRDQILPPLRSPPPEWRAKVESSYTISKDKNPIRRWNSKDANRNAYRSESAPLLDEDRANHAPMADRQKSGSAIGMNNELKQVPAAAFSVDARNQGFQNGKSGFITSPRIQYDFNARAVGWSDQYAAKY